MSCPCKYVIAELIVQMDLAIPGLPTGWKKAMLEELEATHSRDSDWEYLRGPGDTK